MEATGVERPTLDLFDEIARYLALVDELRTGGLEPTWHAEWIEPDEPPVRGIFGSCRTRRWL